MKMDRLNKEAYLARCRLLFRFRDCGSRLTPRHSKTTGANVISPAFLEKND